MTRYIYSGPATGYELKGEEKLVRPGDEIELPPDHPITLGWLAHRYLSDVPADARQASDAQGVESASNTPEKPAVKRAVKGD